MKTDKDLIESIKDTISVAIHDFSVKWNNLEEKEQGMEELSQSLFKSLFNSKPPQPHPKVMELELKIEKAQQMIRDLRDSDAHVCPANDDITQPCTCGDYDKVIDFLNSKHV